MNAEWRSPWPSAAPVTVPADDIPVTVRERLPELVVPTYMFGFAPEATATLVTAPDGRQLLTFATKPSAALCLDPDNGQVLYMSRDPRDASTFMDPIVMNSSLTHFTTTVTEAIKRFPFHTDDADADQMHAAADQLRDHIRQLDPAAWREDGLWDVLCFDISLGMYPPKDFVPPHEPAE